MKTSIQIDSGAGPCFGVQRAIQMAEELLNEQGQLACLGDLIHNDEEIKRLERKGLLIVSQSQLEEQSGKKLLIRAHGEPPTTFRIANNYNVELIDATCPIVKQLQRRVVQASAKMLEQKGQVILFGDLDHPEVIALKGYCKGEFHIVGDVSDVKKIDSAKPTVFFSQTTKYQSDYRKIVEAYTRKRQKEMSMDYYIRVEESICKQVAKRDVQLVDFLSNKDVLVFVSGSKSSNGKYLFDVGKKAVRKAYFISNPQELQRSWFKSGQSIGISGATSTPQWLLENTSAFLKALLN